MTVDGPAEIQRSQEKVGVGKDEGIQQIYDISTWDIRLTDNILQFMVYASVSFAQSLFYLRGTKILFLCGLLRSFTVKFYL